jgi:hypothetical protein
MSLPTSLQSYPDCYDFFDKIADDPRGGRVCLGAEGDANYFRMRCNQFRQLAREESRKVYEEGNPKHGTTEYDRFRLQVKEDTNGKWWVYAIRMQLNSEEIELLSEVEGYVDGNEAGPDQLS